jgi:hypothetical protein
MGRNVPASSSNTMQRQAPTGCHLVMARSFVGQSIACSFPKDQGATLRRDLDKSGALYGGTAKPGNRIQHRSSQAASKVLSLLNRYSPR